MYNKSLKIAIFSYGHHINAKTKFGNIITKNSPKSCKNIKGIMPLYISMVLIVSPVAPFRKKSDNPKGGVRKDA